MRFRKIIGLVHLFLGLASGSIIIIISLTGCIYAFQEEIQDLTQPYRYVTTREESFLPPSRFVTIARDALPYKHLHAVMYYKNHRAVKAIFYSVEPEYYYLVYIDPYTGEVLKVKNEADDFFRIILDGHFNLWLPKETGQLIVSITTLVFFAMVVSGIILWWPRSANGKKQRFTIRWNARWKRRNYDMHSVLGFYVSWIALIFIISGLVWGFEWFRNSYYSVTSAGENFIEYKEPLSTPGPVVPEIPAIDAVWMKMQSEYPNAESIEVHIPENINSSIAANANEDASTYYKTDYRYFDQYNLEELSVDHMWGRINDATPAQMLMRMNYDIHIGSVLGLPGKILAFLSSLLIASLPITGFALWYGRYRKQRRTIHTTPYSVKSK